MRPTSSVCDPARLKRLLDNRLGPDEEAETIRHLDGCAPCQKALEAMAAGSGLWGVARHLDDLWDPGQGAAARAAMPELGPHADHAAAEEGALDFLEPTDRPELLGMLGSYEVVRVLGRGGMGVVFQAFDPALNRPVAIKVLAPELATSGMARRRFAREAQATAAIVHDHVIAIHAVEANARLPYLVMQYVPGHSLQERIDRAGPLALAEVLRIGMQVASGLAAAHAQGVIHRDIKPANILLESSVERVKITDFGLARALDDASMTQSGVITGTPQYMAPEQARGEHVDHRADLFSLGSLLYTMCTGRSPFRAETTLAVLRRVVEDRPRPIREVNPDIPGWLEAIVARLHAKDPSDRHASAAEVAELLGRCLAHVQQPDTAARPVELTAGQPAPRRRVGRGTLAAAVGLVLLAGLGAGEASGLTKLADAIVSVLRIRTDEGTLVVEVLDPEVKVSVDDQELVIRGAGPREVRLRAGFHKLRTQQPGGNDRIELIEITRGGSHLARVSREPEPTKVLDPGASPGMSPRQSAAPEANADLLIAISRLAEAEARLESAKRLSRIESLDPSVKGQENAVKKLREEILRRWPAEALAAERAKTDGGDIPTDERAAGPGSAATLKSIKGRFVLSLAFSPDGRTLATAGAAPRRDGSRLAPGSGELFVWDFRSGRKRFEAVESQTIISVAFSPDGRMIATAGIGIPVTLRDAHTGEIIKMLPVDNRRSSFTAVLSPDGKTIATATFREARLWDVQSGHEVRSFAPPRGAMRSISFAPDGKTLLAAVNDGKAYQWDVATGQLRLELRCESGLVASVAVFAPGSDIAATNGPAGTIKLWDLAEGRELATLEGHTGPVSRAAFSPDGKTLATCGGKRTRAEASGEVILWDVASRRQKLVLEHASDDRYSSLAFSPDGKILATATSHGTVQLWDMRGEKPVRLVPGAGSDRGAPTQGFVPVPAGGAKSFSASVGIHY